MHALEGINNIGGRMESKKNRREALEFLLKLLEPEKYYGVKFNQEKYDKYVKLYELVLECFGDVPDVTFDVDYPSNEIKMPSISVKMPEFEFAQEDNKKFLQILELSEHTCMIANLNGTFGMAFFINNIWDEEEQKNT